MLDQIIKIAKEKFEEETEYGADTSILTDMELSSLEFFSFVSEVEQKLGVHFTERELNRVETLGDLAELAEAKKA